MISVGEALQALFALVEPCGTETVPLRSGLGRVLAQDAVAARDQPPFAASSMDGYALATADAQLGATLRVVGEAAAGRAFRGTLNAGEAVRIFTGAPLPTGATHVEIQENVRRDGDHVTLLEPEPPGANIRPAAGDFAVGARLAAPRRLGPADVALLAAMNLPEVAVARRPEVALISTGDELVMPGEAPAPDQIIASNALGLDAALRQAGALPRILPIARDNAESLASAFRFARGADLIVTIGGASVGDHDLVRQVAGQQGLDQSFYKVAMRPGKPLMAGQIDGVPMIGLPGNPVSALVCGHIFLAPVIRAMQGLPAAPAPRQRAPLAHAIGANGAREHYARARRQDDGTLHVFSRQDSSLLTVLAEANALAVLPPHHPAQPEGAVLEYVSLDTKSEHP